MLTSHGAKNQADIQIAHAAEVTALQVTYAKLEREHALRGLEVDVHRRSHLYYSVATGLLHDQPKLMKQDFMESFTRHQAEATDKE